MKYVYFFMLTTFTCNIFAQNKELLILGTMHKVPEIVKNSYQPMLNYSLKYAPDAIYVEYVMPDDTVSIIYDAPKFVEKSDSIKAIFSPNLTRFETLLDTDLENFTEQDFGFMANTYLVKRDNANYAYFQYLSKYGIDGSPEPLRHENGDLTAKLAIALNKKYLYSMDDQQTNKAYHIAWKDCTDLGAENGDNEINEKLGKKQYTSAVVPALFGKFGKHTNKLKSLNRLHLLSSFRYTKQASESCDNATKYWDERNFRMAKNIGEQIMDESNTKNILLVGASHVVGIKEVLVNLYPEISIKLMHEE